MKIIITLLFALLGFTLAQEPSLESDPYGFMSTIAGAIFTAGMITTFLQTHFLKGLKGLWMPGLAFAIALIIKYALPLIPSDQFNTIIALLLGVMGVGGLYDNAKKILEPKKEVNT